MAAGMGEKAYEDALLSEKGKGNPHPKGGEIKRMILREHFGTGKPYEAALPRKQGKGNRCPQRGVIMCRILLEIFGSGEAYEAALLSKTAKGNPYPKRGEIKFKVFRELFGTEATGGKKNGDTEDGWGGSFGGNAIPPQKA